MAGFGDRKMKSPSGTAENDLFMNANPNEIT